MNKLEFKHVAPYLPYKLMVNCDFRDGDILALELEGLATDEAFLDGADWNYKENTDFKPILKPFSDLTIEEMIVLSKLVADIHNDDMDDLFECSNNGRMNVKAPWDLRIEFMWKGKSLMFAVYDTYRYKEKRVFNQLQAYNKLYEWHYDVHGLIEQGLAIDINTL